MLCRGVENQPRPGPSNRERAKRAASGLTYLLHVAAREAAVVGHLIRPARRLDRHRARGLGLAHALLPGARAEGAEAHTAIRPAKHESATMKSRLPPALYGAEAAQTARMSSRVTVSLFSTQKRPSGLSPWPA